MRVIDVRLLEELRSVMDDDFHTLLETFERDTARRFSLLESALATEDAELLRSTAHTMKGSALGMGAINLSAQFRELEDCGREGELRGVDRKIAAARQGFTETLSQMKSWLDDRWQLRDISR